MATENEAELLARGLLNELALNYIVGEGTAVGDPAIRVGTVIALDGLGKRFNGLYYVTQVAHRLGWPFYHPPSGQEKCGMNFVQGDAQYTLADASGRIYGVVVGIVTANEDSEGLGRVKARFPGWLATLRAPGHASPP